MYSFVNQSQLVETVRAINRCPNVQCHVDQDCQFSLCAQNDIPWNSRCLKKGEVLSCATAANWYKNDPINKNNFIKTSSTNRCDGVECVSHSQCQNWCHSTATTHNDEKVQAVCASGYTKDIQNAIVILVISILVSFVDLLYIKFIKNNSLLMNQRSGGSPKG